VRRTRDTRIPNFPKPAFLLPPSYSIISSARMRIDGGTDQLSALRLRLRSRLCWLINRGFDGMGVGPFDKSAGSRRVIIYCPSGIAPSRAVNLPISDRSDEFQVLPSTIDRKAALSQIVSSARSVS
jgi:hypothetical protein